METVIQTVAYIKSNNMLSGLSTRTKTKKLFDFRSESKRLLNSVIGGGFV